jgi:hypothetical protein
MVTLLVALIWAFLLIPLFNFNIRFNRLIIFPTIEDIHRMKDAPMWIRVLTLLISYLHHENRSVYEMLIHLLSLIGIVIFQQTAD